MRGGELAPLVQRLERKHRLTEAGCWEWTGSRDQKGYGRTTIGSRTDGSRRPVRVHRLAWELFRGPIPPGLQIDHRCRNRRCFNPEHLRVATPRENNMAPGSESLTARFAERTHCAAGHPFSGSNLRMRPGGARECRTCMNAYKREWHRKRKLKGAS
jgi:hypothetical protein